MEVYQDEQVNIDPAVTADLNDLKEEYENFEGTVCVECYYKICRPEFEGTLFDKSKVK